MKNSLYIRQCRNYVFHMAKLTIASETKKKYYVKLTKQGFGIIFWVTSKMNALNSSNDSQQHYFNEIVLQNQDHSVI